MKKLIIALIITLIASLWTGCESENKTAVTVPAPTEAQYTDNGGVGYNEGIDGNLSTASFKSKKKDVVITSEINGKKVKAIGRSSFKMSDAETVTIPDTVEKIEDYAFAFSRNLKKVIIPESVKSIGTNAFAGCGKLTEVKLPKKLNTIGMYSFDGTGLKNITIPKTVNKVDEYAFAECKSLKNVTFNGKKTEIAKTAFNHSPLINFTAPEGSKAVDFAKEYAVDYKFK